MAEYSIETPLRRPRFVTFEVGQLQPDRRSEASPPTVYRGIVAFARLIRWKLHDVVLLARFTSHIVVLTLAVLVTLAGHVQLRIPRALLPRIGLVEPRVAPQPVWWTSTARRTQVRLNWHVSAVNEPLITSERPAVARTEPVIYKVQAGDNPYLIATRFGLQPESIVWANPTLEDDPNLLSIGQELLIPPTDGVLHTVESGETLTDIAEAYDVTVEDIIGYSPNNLGRASELVEGQWVMVPGGEKPFLQAASTPAPGQWAPAPEAFGGATGTFVWPTQGRITQGAWAGHVALDIANATGTPVRASDSGVVVFAGWSNTGYGYNVVIDHGNGFRTRYAHLSYYHVEAGQRVDQHQLIGKIGSTGRSTGPHLHFEVIYNGIRQSPYNYLR